MKLSVKLFLLVIFLVVFFAIGYQLIFYFQIQQNIIDSRVLEAKSVIQLASDEMRDSVYFLDYDELNYQISNLKKNPLIENVYVMYPDGRILTTSEDDNLLNHKILENGFIHDSINSDMILVKVDKNEIRLSAPIKITEKIGILHMDYSLLDIHTMLYDSIFSLLFFTTILSAIGIGLGFFITSSVTTPIKRIRKISDELAKGNFNVKFDEKISSTDEIDALLKDIRKMALDLKKYQNEIIKSEKLSTIGEMSARISHDIRNPLNVIRASLENIQLKYGQLPETGTSFSRINRSIDRIAHQTEDVLEFVQSRSLEKEVVSLTEIISESVTMLQIPIGITIEKPKQDISLYCDYVKICTLFKNLIYNSIQACDDGGVIEIKTENNPDYVLIFIIDSGSGIPKENIDRIFEPLFTTKQKGTGLGLASCKTIVESHGGSIRVKNNPTTFEIMLPQPTKDYVPRS